MDADVIDIDRLKVLMSSGEPICLVDVRGPEAVGGFIPTSLRFNFGTGRALPFELEKNSSSAIVMVLYEGAGHAQALSIRRRVYQDRPRVFVLAGGFAAYLNVVTDPATGQPFPGSVSDFVPNSVPVGGASEPALVPSEKMLHRISSMHSLDDEEPQNDQNGAAIAAAAPIDEQVNQYLGGKGNKNRPEWTADNLVEVRDWRGQEMFVFFVSESLFCFSPVHFAISVLQRLFESITVALADRFSALTAPDTLF